MKANNSNACKAKVAGNVDICLSKGLLRLTYFIYRSLCNSLSVMAPSIYIALKPIIASICFPFAFAVFLTIFILFIQNGIDE